MTVDVVSKGGGIVAERGVDDWGGANAIVDAFVVVIVAAFVVVMVTTAVMGAPFAAVGAVLALPPGVAGALQPTQTASSNTPTRRRLMIVRRSSTDRCSRR